MQISKSFSPDELRSSFEWSQKVFSNLVPDEKQLQLTEAQKCDKYNCLKAFQMCLEDEFGQTSMEILQTYIKQKKKQDLQEQILRAAKQKMEDTPAEELMKEFNILYSNGAESIEDDHDLFDEQPEMFKVQPSDFKNDVEYANAIIKKVRRTHSIDDRLENARRESISTNHTTRNIWPTSLSCPLLKNGQSSTSELQECYFVKAIVPIQKQTYQITYSADNLTAKPKFKLFGDGEKVHDHVIFGILTAKNFVG